MKPSLSALSLMISEMFEQSKKNVEIISFFCLNRAEIFGLTIGTRHSLSTSGFTLCLISTQFGRLHRTCDGQRIQQSQGGTSLLLSVIHLPLTWMTSTLHQSGNAWSCARTIRSDSHSTVSLEDITQHNCHFKWAELVSFDQLLLCCAI